VLALEIGRGIGRDDNLRASCTGGPRRFGSPHIFADDHTNSDSGHFDDQRLITRNEIATLVEDGVVGQVPLVVGAENLPVAQPGYRVVALVGFGTGMADDDVDTAYFGGNLGQRRVTCAHETGAQYQVFGRIARQRQFREYDQVGTQPVTRLRNLREDAIPVAGDLTDLEVVLGECDAKHYGLRFPVSGFRIRVFVPISTRKP